MKLWLGLLMVVVAILSWTGYALLRFQLSSERVAYAAALASAEEQALRGESSTRLRTTVQSTEAERAALDSLVGITVLQAVEVIEQAGRAAGATDVTIGSATSGTAPKGLSSVTIVVNANGSYATLHRVVSLFESLPIPSQLEQFELEKLEQKNSWRLTARLRVYMALP